MKKETIIVIAIAAAIIVGNWLFLGNREGAPEEGGVDASAEDFLTVTEGSISRSGGTQGNGVGTTPSPTARPAVLPAAGGMRDMIRVEDQEPGIMVRIAELRLADIAWIVVHEDRDGAPGNILGAQRLRPTDMTGTVELLRATEDGGLYYAMIHTDDGDNAFDPAKDVPKKDANGNVIMVRFVAE